MGLGSRGRCSLGERGGVGSFIGPKCSLSRSLRSGRGLPSSCSIVILLLQFILQGICDSEEHLYYTPCTPVPEVSSSVITIQGLPVSPGTLGFLKIFSCLLKMLTFSSWYFRVLNSAFKKKPVTHQVVALTSEY